MYLLITSNSTFSFSLTLIFIKKGQNVMHYSIGEEHQSSRDGMNVGLTGGVNGLRFYFAGVL